MDSVRFVGEPCALMRDKDMFDKFGVVIDGIYRKYCVGDMFLVRDDFHCHGTKPCLAELKFMFFDGSTENRMVYVQLYMLPEQTPGGRQSHHGEHEVIADTNTKSTTLEQLAEAIVEVPNWNYGMVYVGPPPVPPEPVGPQEEIITGDIVYNDPSLVQKKFSVFSYPYYSHYRRSLERLGNKSVDTLDDKALATLGLSADFVYCMENKVHVFFCRNIPSGESPTLKQLVNLYLMFKKAQDLGGYTEISRRRLWRSLYHEMGCDPGSTNAAYSTRKHYERLVLPFENLLKKQKKAAIEFSSQEEAEIAAKTGSCSTKKKEVTFKEETEEIKEKTKPEIVPTASIRAPPKLRPSIKRSLSTDDLVVSPKSEIPKPPKRARSKSCRRKSTKPQKVYIDKFDEVRVAQKSMPPKKRYDLDESEIGVAKVLTSFAQKRKDKQEKKLEPTWKKEYNIGQETKPESLFHTHQTNKPHAEQSIKEQLEQSIKQQLEQSTTTQIDLSTRSQAEQNFPSHEEYLPALRIEEGSLPQIQQGSMAQTEQSYFQQMKQGSVPQSPHRVVCPMSQIHPGFISQLSQDLMPQANTGPMTRSSSPLAHMHPLSGISGSNQGPSTKSNISSTQMNPSPSTHMNQGFMSHMKSSGMMQMSPGPMIQMSPSPMMQMSPGPMMHMSPGPMMQMSPSPMMPMSPNPMMQMSPGPVSQMSPSLMAQMSPSLLAQMSPSLMTQMSPSLMAQMSPSSLMQIASSSMMQMKSSTATQMNPTSMTRMKPGQASQIRSNPASPQIKLDPLPPMRTSRMSHLIPPGHMSQIIPGSASQMISGPIQQIIPGHMQQMKIDPMAQLQYDTMSHLQLDPMSHMKLDPMLQVKYDPGSQIKLDALLQMKLDPMLQVKYDPMTQMKLEPMSQMKFEPMSQMMPEHMAQIMPHPMSHVMPHSLSQGNQDHRTQMDMAMLSQMVPPPPPPPPPPRKIPSGPILKLRTSFTEQRKYQQQLDEDNESPLHSELFKNLTSPFANPLPPVESEAKYAPVPYVKPPSHMLIMNPHTPSTAMRRSEPLIYSPKDNIVPPPFQTDLPKEEPVDASLSALLPPSSPVFDIPFKERKMKISKTRKFRAESTDCQEQAPQDPQTSVAESDKGDNNSEMHPRPSVILHTEQIQPTTSSSDAANGQKKITTVWPATIVQSVTIDSPFFTSSSWKGMERTKQYYDPETKTLHEVHLGKTTSVSLPLPALPPLEMQPPKKRITGKRLSELAKADLYDKITESFSESVLPRPEKKLATAKNQVPRKNSRSRKQQSPALSIATDEENEANRPLMEPEITSSEQEPKDEASQSESADSKKPHHSMPLVLSSPYISSLSRSVHIKCFS